MPDPSTTLHVPARDIPIPSGLSPGAQAQLARGTLSNPAWPAVDDIPAWRALIASMDEMGLAGLSMMAQSVQADVEEIDVDGVRVFVATPHGLAADDTSVYLDIHGGALLWGGGPICRVMSLITAGMVGAKVWAVDYRMPPDHPYPAGLDDCVNAYRELLTHKEPHQIVVGGNSAGGNLAAAMLLRARDEGLPLPAAAILGTPQADLTESGDSFQTNLGLDALLGSTMPANLLYAGGQALDHPYLSPLFGDFTKGFPPTLLFTGTRDLFLSNTVRMHRALRAADVPADLHVFEAASHGQFPDSPEERALNREIHQFLDLHWR